MRPYGHIFPKMGRSLDTAHPRLCVGIFKYCWTESFVLFLILFSWTGLSGEDQVEQSPQTLRIQEGDSPVSTAATLPAVLKGYSGTDKIPERARNSSSFFTQLGMKSRKKDWEPPC